MARFDAFRIADQKLCRERGRREESHLIPSPPLPGSSERTQRSNLGPAPLSKSSVALAAFTVAGIDFVAVAHRMP